MKGYGFLSLGQARNPGAAEVVRVLEIAGISNFRRCQFHGKSITQSTACLCAPTYVLSPRRFLQCLSSLRLYVKFGVDLDYLLLIIFYSKIRNPVIQPAVPVSKRDICGFVHFTGLDIQLMPTCWATYAWTHIPGTHERDATKSLTLNFSLSTVY
jgi:hypothetical protein